MQTEKKKKKKERKKEINKEKKRKENLRIASAERRLHLVLTKVLFL